MLSATICTALLCDIGLVTDTDQTMIIDKSKVRRERNVIQNKLIDDSQLNDTDEPITAIYLMVGKNILVHLEDTKGLNHIKEEHYALVEQPHGEYHLTFSLWVFFQYQTRQKFSLSLLISSDCICLRSNSKFISSKSLFFCD